VEPSRTEELTSSPPSTPSPTTIFWLAKAWPLTSTSDGICGSIEVDGRALFVSTSIPPQQRSSSTGRRILVSGKGSAGWLHRCLALLSDARQRSIGGAIVCWDSPTEE
jgi:hypothetical protein